MGTVKELWSDGWTGRTLLVFLAVLVLLIFAVIYGSYKDAEEWKAFAASHECKKVGHMSGSMQTGVGIASIGGQIGPVITTNSTLSKTGWLCDDGITYWR